MEILYMYSVFVLLLVPRIGHTQPPTDGTCGPAAPPSTQVAPVYTDLRLDGFQVSHLMGFTLERCVLECFLVTLCTSFNYREQLGVCALNNVTAAAVDAEHLVNTTDFVYHELQAWSDFQTMAGTCASRPCAENQRCIQTEPLYTCVVVDCGPPPPYLHGLPPFQFYITSSPEVTSLGSRAVYTCNDDFSTGFYYPNDEAPFYNSGTKLCNSDYTWSKNRHKCGSSINTCAHIQNCNPAYEDGHYLIKHFASIAARAIIYCHDMAGDEPQTFITLPEFETVSVVTNDTEQSWTYYHKIRIDGRFVVNISDMTFAELSGDGDEPTPLPLGMASGCGGYGYFVINTTGTGFIVDPNTEWTADPTTDLDDLILAGSYVEGLCWEPDCEGLCYPDGDLKLEWDYNPTHAVDGSDVNLPVCV